MLALTPTAAEVVESIVSQQELPDTAGVRITSEQGEAAADGSGSQRDLRLSVVEQPETGDALIEGTQVYVEPGETADMLDDKVLDAEVEGNEVRFSIAQQAGPDEG
jgi:iron-sulfur cluster assembly protein